MKNTDIKSEYIKILKNRFRLKNQKYAIARPLNMIDKEQLIEKEK